MRSISFRNMVAGGIVIVVFYLVLVVVASKWAIDISHQTEQNFADAIRTMQGK